MFHHLDDIIIGCLYLYWFLNIETLYKTIKFTIECNAIASFVLGKSICVQGLINKKIVQVIIKWLRVGDLNSYTYNKITINGNSDVLKGYVLNCHRNTKVFSCCKRKTQPFNSMRSLNPFNMKCILGSTLNNMFTSDIEINQGPSSCSSCSLIDSDIWWYIKCRTWNKR